MFAVSGGDMKMWKKLAALGALSVAVSISAIIPERWKRFQRDRAYPQLVEACARSILSNDPLADARDDIARNEDRFYFDAHNGTTVTFSADGFTPPDRGGARCSPTRAAWPLRDWPQQFQRFAEFTLVSGNDGDNTAPQQTSCGMAMNAYFHAYNREMARLNPQSITRYCQP